MGLRSAKKSLYYQQRYEPVFEAAKKALSDGGFIVQSIDEKSGIMKAYTGVSFRSYGENIIITVLKTEKGIHVTAYSKARAAICDWGKSRENVNRFFAALHGQLHPKRVKSSFSQFE